MAKRQEEELKLEDMMMMIPAQDYDKPDFESDA